MFLRKMYGVKANDTDEVHYMKFTANKKTPEPQCLPPARDALLCHCKKVSYVMRIIKRSLQPHASNPDPAGHG